MHIDITCQTDRFNLSVVGDDFINDCCFGEDFSRWLVAALQQEGIQADLICMEDFGWANSASWNGTSYLVCVTGVPDEDPSRPDYGQWHVMVSRKRTLLQKISGRNQMTLADPLLAVIERALTSAGFAQLAVEP